MPTYDFSCEKCKHEWEVFQSMSAPNPEECPNCKATGQVKKLISLSSKGVVELYGQDLVDKIKDDTKQLQKEMHKSPNTYANLLGEDKYHQIQSQMDKQRREK